MTKPSNSPWAWVPSLYFSQGFAYVTLVLLTEIHFQQLGLSNTLITLYASLLGIPWVIKPFIAPWLEQWASYKEWVYRLQYLIGIGFCAAMGLSYISHLWFYVALFLVSCLASAQDFAADGVYLATLDEQTQNHFIGFRGAAYQAGRLICLGPLVILLGLLQAHHSIHQSWVVVLSIIGFIFIMLALYHQKILPQTRQNQTQFNWIALKQAMRQCFTTLPNWLALLFIFFMLNGQMQLAKILPLYILDTGDHALSLGPIYLGHWFGTAGTVAIVIGGIAGSYLLRFISLSKALMLSFGSSAVITALFALPLLKLTDFTSLLILNQFLFGILATLQSATMLRWARKNHFPATAYAIAASIMVLGFLFPGFYAGWIQETIGYRAFFLWCAICTLLMPTAVGLKVLLQRLS